MRLSLVLLALSLLVPAPRPAAAELVDLELILAVDVSGSVDEEEAELQRAGYVRALTDDRVIRTIKAGRFGRIAVTYVEWAGDHVQRVVVDWSVIDGKATATDFARRLAAAPFSVEMWTSISSVIEFAGPRFSENPHRGRRRVLDISGDGPNNDGVLVTGPRDQAVAAGITINGLPIMNGRPSRYGLDPMPHLDHYYEDCVIGGRGAFIVVANSFRDFGRAVRRKLILEIAGLTPPRPLWTLVQARRPMPCNAGEIWLRENSDDL